jgi:hypothetical protein
VHEGCDYQVSGPRKLKLYDLLTNAGPANVLQIVPLASQQRPNLRQIPAHWHRLRRRCVRPPTNAQRRGVEIALQVASALHLWLQRPIVRGNDHDET